MFGLAQRLKVLISLLLLCASVPALAQDARNRLSPPPPGWRPPVIWLPPIQEKLQPLSLQSVDIDIKVHGHVATTSMELAFYNPNSRVLEGELVFPLGVGQTVSGYALEVEGKMRQAVAVPKEKAREVFESVTRAGIDPGLAELTKGNVFRTRIYPIPARGSKRVMVAFDQELSDAGNGLRYLLPMGYAQKIGRLRVHAEVIKQEIAPVLDQGMRPEALSFSRWNDSYVAETVHTDYVADKPLAFIIPRQANAMRSFMVTDTLEPSQSYFNLSILPAISPVPKARPVKHVALFYDASGSAAARDRKSEHAALAAYLKQMGKLSVDLVVFRNDADAPRRFEIADGDSSALIAVLEALPLDGGTSLGAIDLNAVPHAERVLVISDGLSNFSERDIRERNNAAPASLPLYALHAAQSADHAALERITRRHGGQVVNLLALSSRDAVAALNRMPFQYLGAKVVRGKISDLAPALPVALTRDFTLAGRCDGRASHGRCEIELQFGYGGAVTSTRRVVLDGEQALAPTAGAFVRRLWAQKRIAELELDARKNDAMITELAKDNGLVSRNTSLLVLDRLEDYVRHRIVPPEPELLAPYQERIARLPKIDAGRADEAHLASVARRWGDFKAWHDKRHPWLESVLAPAADYEARVIAGLAQQTNKSMQPSQQQVETAEALRKQAADLAARWPEEGKTDAGRAAWEREAIAAMLALDRLRQERMRIAPHARPADDRVASAHGSGRMNALREEAPRPAMAAPPPAPVGAAAQSARAKLSEADAGMAKREAVKPTVLSGTIAIKPWNPDTPYLRKLRAAKDAYEAYLEERKENAGSSAFYLDCADFFREEKKDERLALRVLSNLAEMELENAPLLRILAYRLQQFGRHDLAVALFEEVLQMRGEEPQSRRDLAIALSRQAKPDVERAASLWWEIVKRKWDGRFPNIEIIALHELNALVESLPASRRPDLARLGVDARLIGGVPVELRVVLTWDADNTDIDLHVIDPAGETHIFSNPRGKTGGLVSSDFTGGYGPEVFTIKRPLPGTYTVKTNYYGNRQQKLAGATTVQVEFQTGFGTPHQSIQAVTRRLKEARDIIEIGSFTVAPK